MSVDVANTLPIQDNHDQSLNSRMHTTPAYSTTPFTNDTFGEISREHDAFGASRFNPTGLEYNCVPVVLTKLTGYANVEELGRALGYQRPLDTGHSLNEVTELLRKTGRKFVLKEIYSSADQDATTLNFMIRLARLSEQFSATTSPQTSAARPTVQRSLSREKQKLVQIDLRIFPFLPRGMLELARGYSESGGVETSNKLEVGILYVRADGTGHCVVGTFTVTEYTHIEDKIGLQIKYSKINRQTISWSFLCFQHDDHGVDVAAEVCAATKVLFFTFTDNEEDKYRYLEEFCNKAVLERALNTGVKQRVRRLLGNIKFTNDLLAVASSVRTSV